MIFITHTNALADQQKDRFKKYFPEFHHYRIQSAADSSISASKMVKELIDSRKICTMMFTTYGLFHQILMNNEETTISFANFQMIIVDEAHNCTGDSNLQEIFKNYIAIKHADKFKQVYIRNGIKEKYSAFEEIMKKVRFKFGNEPDLPRILALSATVRIGKAVDSECKAVTEAFESLARLDTPNIACVAEQSVDLEKYRELHL